MATESSCGLDTPRQLGCEHGSWALAVVPLTTVYCFIAFNFFAFLPFVRERDNSTEELVLVCFALTVFNVLWVLMVWSWLKALLTSPGGPLPVDDADEERRSIRNGHRCRKCNAIKPERTHHCSICNRCVYRMDHHCPWVNNCVGQQNYKFFFLFVMYTELECLCALLFLLGRYHIVDWQFHRRDIPVIPLVAITGLFAIMLSGLFINHLIMIINNITTLELLERRANREEGADECCHSDHPYNQDIRTNMQEVCGPLSCWWLLPVGVMDDDYTEEEV